MPPFWQGEGWGSGGLVFWRPCQGEEDGVMGQEKGTERPERRREHGVLAGDAGRGQVNHSQGFGLYSRAVGCCGSFSVGEGQMCVLGNLSCS